MQKKKGNNFLSHNFLVCLKQAIYKLVLRVNLQVKILIKRIKNRYSYFNLDWKMLELQPSKVEYPLNTLFIDKQSYY